ncbi:hypothetical protein FKM82_026034 [Ascaphus truei]
MLCRACGVQRGGCVSGEGALSPTTRLPFLGMKGSGSLHVVLGSGSWRVVLGSGSLRVVLGSGSWRVVLGSGSWRVVLYLV